MKKNLKQTLKRKSKKQFQKNKGRIKNLLLPPTWNLVLPSFMPNSKVEC
jgi:hypothetical protein